MSANENELPIRKGFVELKLSTTVKATKYIYQNRLFFVNDGKLTYEFAEVQDPTNFNPKEQQND